MVTDGLTIYRLVSIEDTADPDTLNPDVAYGILILVNSCI